MDQRREALGRDAQPGDQALTVLVARRAADAVDEDAVAQLAGGGQRSQNRYFLNDASPERRVIVEESDTLEVQAVMRRPEVVKDVKDVEARPARAENRQLLPAWPDHRRCSTVPAEPAGQARDCRHSTSAATTQSCSDSVSSACNGSRMTESSASSLFCSATRRKPSGTPDGPAIHVPGGYAG